MWGLSLALIAATNKRAPDAVQTTLTRIEACTIAAFRAGFRGR
jgi:hypothetical protein